MQILHNNNVNNHLYRKQFAHQAKAKIHLPEGFYQNIIELENKFIYGPCYQIVQELLLLYKVR